MIDAPRGDLRETETYHSQAILDKAEWTSLRFAGGRSLRLLDIETSNAEVLQGDLVYSIWDA